MVNLGCGLSIYTHFPFQNQWTNYETSWPQPLHLVRLFNISEDIVTLILVALASRVFWLPHLQ